MSSGMNETTQIGTIILFLKNASRYRAVKVNGTIYRNLGANLLTANVVRAEIKTTRARYQNLLVSLKILLLRKYITRKNSRVIIKASRAFPIQKTIFGPP